MTATNEISPGQTPSHGLRWGVKASFVSYVSSLEDGRVTATDGAEATANSEFFFPFLRAEIENTEPFVGSLHFSGTVDFYGHFGMMALTLRNLVLSVSRDACHLLAEIRGEERLLAKLPPREPRRTEAGLTWNEWIPTLTVEGAREFRDSYSPGEELSPLSISVPLSR